MPRPSFKYEDSFDAPVCGLDEAGRGPLAGPVVAAAVIIDRKRMPRRLLADINDSKQLTPKKRAAIYAVLPDYAEVSIAEVSVPEIDAINILQASLLAMRKAFDSLRTRPAVALVDGNQLPGLACKTQTIIGGDAKSLSIAAASIAAKEYRDRLMHSYARDFPQYGWEQNAGYGTAHHLKAIEIYGITPLHRRSFAPVSKHLVKESSVKN